MEVGISWRSCTRRDQDTSGSVVPMLLVCLFVFGATAPSGPGPSHSRGFYITQNDAPQSVGLLWTSDQLVTETST